MRCSDSLRQVSSSFDICFSQCETNLPIARIVVFIVAATGRRGTVVLFCGLLALRRKLLFCTED